MRGKAGFVCEDVRGSEHATYSMYVFRCLMNEGDLTGGHRRGVLTKDQGWGHGL